ncbi:UbiA prenyltransferase [Halovivax asiaticus JCM 14624]|uniref:UbiA prenyltransferase n=1 Tax=Halovivax asiaticus JCM 14624 TaxID=1227490 RepID=M0BC06_9EURY|nr:UbiA family prenyltransferase [Halovivax asiaticus]ELZ07189.1 UbiA prenyltransferase [Halovivax asiaticus JCM 14624]
MAVSRHGSGLRADLRAYASQVHPVFMLPPVAASLFGAVLTTNFTFFPAAVHAVAIFAAVYTAHVKDGYVDFHVRDEDDDHPLTVAGCLAGLYGATALFAVATLILAVGVDLLAAALTVPTWVIAYLHAPQLDVHPIGATMGYPAGIGLAILGGYAAQTGTLSPLALAFALVFLVVLTGIKVVDDTTDVTYDRTIRKRTVAVVLGTDRAIFLAYGLIGVGLVTCLVFVLVGLFPLGSILAVAALALVAVTARRAPPKLATMLLIRGCYVFLAVLVAAVWFEPVDIVL